MTDALHAYDSLRAAVYRDGLAYPHLDDLRGVVTRLEAVAADRRVWIASTSDQAAQELEQMLHETVLHALLDAVGSIAGSS